MAQYALSRSPSTPTPHTNTLQDVSGTLSLLVEVTMVAVNVFPIVVALRRRRQNEGLVTDQLVLALSLTHILSVLVPTPFGLVSYFNKSWYGGRATCEFYQLTMLWFQVVCILLVTYLCTDRLVALRMALYYTVSPLNVAARVKYFVLAIYLLSLALVSLPLMGLAPPAMSTSTELCESWLTAMPNSRAQSVFYMSLLVLGYGNLLAVLLVGSRVTAMVWTLQRKLSSVSGRGQANLVQLRTDRKSIVEFTWMILTVTVLFYLTWFPTMLMLTMQKVGYKVSDIAILYALLSTNLTGLLNPLIYGLFSKCYRRGYRQILSALLHFFCRRRHTQFQPIPAIAAEGSTGIDADVFVNRANDSESQLKRSRSLHDRPFGFGFYNYGFQTSMYSALTDYQLTKPVTKSKTSVDLDFKGRKRRARSLSPPSCVVRTSLSDSALTVRSVSRLSVNSECQASQSSGSHSASFEDAESDCTGDEEDERVSFEETRI